MQGNSYKQGSNCRRAYRESKDFLSQRAQSLIAGERGDSVSCAR